VPEPVLDVACGGTVHRLRCAGGEVHLEDHADLDAERALVALGGAPPECLRRRDLWEAAVADGGFLDEWVAADGLTRARRSWLTTAYERSLTEGFQEYLRHLPYPRAVAACRFLLGFPPEWIDAAAVEVGRRVVHGGDVACQHAPAYLDEAIAQRVRRAFAASLARGSASLGFAALVPLRVNVVPGGVPVVTGVLDGRNSSVAITVDRSWLPDVWGAGLASPSGELVVGRRGDAALVVRWSEDRGRRWPTVVACGEERDVSRRGEVRGG
jgi:hypothetical protein